MSMNKIEKVVNGPQGLLLPGSKGELRRGNPGGGVAETFGGRAIHGERGCLMAAMGYQTWE